ncbi:protein of unknown function [Natronincola peptidivorans]|uniref:DUF3298 domain-containing protein n=1 Tax=Natronincola peptidivorans TaxID=426128 RepID=A0A1I0DLK1_9FIRM|nr:DUF3298 and DUF4163 domain-containing protein [Natronincola peptidivorans]SET33349.1 protein of unknown function [Natronincola peptidivorans]
MIREEGKAKIIKRRIIKQRIGVTYPDIIGLENKEAQKEINALIQEEIYRMIIEQGFEEDYTKEIWGDYKVKYNKNNLFSILIYINSYSKGAAHGLTAVKGINVDLCTGRSYQLMDLFMKDSNYISTINEIINHQIMKRKVPLLIEFETIDKKQDFYLKEEALVVFFQIYEYTPYDFGIPEFEIPYTEIQDCFDTKGPAKAII